MTAPQNINGCDVIASAATGATAATRAGHVVLVQRDTGYHPYVTAWLGIGDSQWNTGHYFVSLSEARDDFEKRARRGY